jgi:Ca-activated chloride channel homolog
VSRQNVRLILAVVALVVIFKAIKDRDRTSGEHESVDRATREIERLTGEMQPPADAPKVSKEGLAAAIVIDVSGSMKDEVDGRDGQREEKIAIARRAALDLVDQFAGYAKDHPDEPVQLGVFEFSRRRGDPDCRPVVPMAPPDRERAAAAIAALRADGGTPIGQAMITAKLALDSAGLSRRHLLVVTDGKNTDGVPPDHVAIAIGKRPDAERPAIYFVAFDVEASHFSSVRDAGGLILSAANATELNDTLDALLRGKILVEK